MTTAPFRPTGARLRIRLFRPVTSAVLALSMALGSALCLGSAAQAQAPEPAQVAAVAVPPPAARPIVLAMRIGEHPDKTRLVLEVSQATAFRVSPLADPARLLLELPELDWAAGPAPTGKGLLRTVRMSAASGGVTRLELDIAGPARIVSAEYIPPREGKPPRFILDIAPTDAAGFLAQKAVASGRLGAATTAPVRTAAVTPPPPQVQAPAPQAPAPQAPIAQPPSTQPPTTQPAVTPAPQAQAAAPITAQPIPAAATGAPKPSLPVKPPAVPAAAALVPKPPQAQKPMIVIDAGHGGEDPGALSVHGAYEKEITLAAALEAKRQLEATGRYRVGLTRDKDFFIPLRDRTAKARALGADLFISLHADSIGTDKVRGMSVYTLSDKASDREAESLAARENRSDAIVGLDLSAESAEVAGILIDLAQRQTRNSSARFANLVAQELGREVPLLPKPLRSAGFAVLTAPDVPSVLIEMGYLSHETDAKLLASPAHRRKMAAGLVRAIDAYFGKAPLKNS